MSDNQQRSWIDELANVWPPLMTVPEASKAIRRHPTYIRKLIASGELVGIAPGSTRRSEFLVPRADLLRYLKAHIVVPDSD